MHPTVTDRYPDLSVGWVVCCALIKWLDIWSRPGDTGVCWRPFSSLFLHLSLLSNLLSNHGAVTLESAGDLSLISSYPSLFILPLLTPLSSYYSSLFLLLYLLTPLSSYSSIFLLLSLLTPLSSYSSLFPLISLRTHLSTYSYLFLLPSLLTPISSYFLLTPLSSYTRFFSHEWSHLTLQFRFRIIFPLSACDLSILLFLFSLLVSLLGSLYIH